MTVPKQYQNLNKYNLTPKLIRQLIPDREKIKKRPFWRNNVIAAWCISGTTIKTDADDRYGTYSEYWLGIYDENVKAYAGQVRFYMTAYGGMCSYNITRFLQPSEIENADDLNIQIKFLTTVNDLIDRGVLKLPE